MSSAVVSSSRTWERFRRPAVDKAISEAIQVAHATNAPLKIMADIFRADMAEGLRAQAEEERLAALTYSTAVPNPPSSTDTPKSLRPDKTDKVVLEPVTDPTPVPLPGATMAQIPTVERESPDPVRQFSSPENVSQNRDTRREASPTPRAEGCPTFAKNLGRPLTSRRRALPDSTWDILDNGRSTNKSEDAWAIIWSFVQQGYDVVDIIKGSFDQDYGGLEHYRSVAKRRGRKEAVAKIRRDWSKAVKLIEEFPAKTDDFTVQYQLTAIADAIDARPDLFTGKEGTTDRLVIIALITLARKVGRLHVSMGVREGSILSNVGKNTVAKSLTRLTKAGEFVQLVTKSKDSDAAVYRLRLPKYGRKTETPDAVEEPRRSETILTEIDDLFAARNLGPGPGLTYGLLSPREGTSIKDLTTMRGVHSSTVRRHLTRLTVVGLVEKVDGLYRQTVKTVRSVAKDIGAKTVRAYRQQQYDQEKQGWFLWLERKRTFHERKKRWQRANIEAHKIGLEVDGYDLIDRRTGQLVGTFDNEYLRMESYLLAA